MAVPTRPTPALKRYSFPNDLRSETSPREYYTNIQLVQYDSSYAVGTNPYTVPKDVISLPLPKKINDVTVANWEALSATQVAAQIGNLSGVGPIADLIGGAIGYAVNPFLWMLFKGMNFKEHQFTWTLTPNTAQESVALLDIITYLKANMLPTANDFSLLMGYPLIALIKFYPNDIFGQFRFKPCAISAVNVDYTGAGGPSFFRNGAPTVVNLTLFLKEIEIWTRNNYFTSEYDESIGASTPPRLPNPPQTTGV